MIGHQLVHENSGHGSGQMPLSELLLSFRPLENISLTFSDMANKIADRSLGGLLAFFAALNLFPLPPGTSAITGIPIVLIAIQLIFLQKRLWLPKILRTKKIDAVRMENVIVRLVKWTQRLEYYLKPRFWPFTVVIGERLVGVISLFLGLMVVFPIPLGNFTPALSAAILGMALSERDGIWFAIGIVAAVLSLIWVATLISGAWYAVNSI